MMVNSHLGHDSIVGDYVMLANNATLAGHVHVGDWVICGGFSGAHQFCKIGAHAFLGMYTGVNRDVPAYTMVSGQPAVALLAHRLDELVGELLGRHITDGIAFLRDAIANRMKEMGFSQANPAEDQKRVKRSAPRFIGHCQAG